MLTAPVATMSMAEIYFLASKAQSKLTHGQASKSNHNLRVLVSHANILDNLMESLSEKEDGFRNRAETYICRLLQ